MPQNEELRGNIIYKLLLTAFLVSVVLGGYIFWQHNQVLKGTIYLSLLPKDGSVPLSVYKFNISKKLLEQEFFGEDKYLTAVFSPDKQKMAFASIHDGEKMDIFIRHKNGSTEQLTGDPSLFIRRNPTWSPKGDMIAYMARKDAMGSDLSIAEWGIYTYDLVNNTENFLTEGANPLFAPTGELMVLRGDGLYLLDIQRGIERKIWNIDGGEGFAHMKLDISPNGKFIAWAVPHRDRLLIIEVASWRPFSGTIVKEYETAGYWPVFSSNNRGVTFEEIDRDPQNPNPRLVVFDLKTDKKTILLNLDEFNQDAMFVSDWK